jgi:NADH-quinone oxidoreductase subunit G
MTRPTTHSHVKPSVEAQSIATMMLGASEPETHSAVLLGNSVMSHPEAASIWLAAQGLAETLGSRIGFTVEGGNGVGGYFAKARPTSDGLDAAAMFDRQADAFLLVGIDPMMDCGNPHQAYQSLKAARSVIGLTAFKDGIMDVATLVLPITPFTETSGTYISCEGRVQTTQAVVRPRGEARPGWKVLRVLGNLVGAEGFDQESSEEVRRQVIGDVAPGTCLGGLSAKVQPSLETSSASSMLALAVPGSLIRVADVPIYRSDSLARHAESLQATSASAAPKARIHPADLLELGLAQGSTVKLTQTDRAQAILEVMADPMVGRGVVRVSTAHPKTAKLGAMIGTVTVEAA